MIGQRKSFFESLKLITQEKAGAFKFQPDKSNGGILKFKSAIEYDEEENNTNKASYSQ